MKTFTTKLSGIYLLIVTLSLLSTMNSFAQLTSGTTYTIDNTATGAVLFPTGAKFNSFTTAVAALNATAANSISSNVIFNVVAGQTFSEPAVRITYTNNNASNPRIIFQNNGTPGVNNPVLQGTNGNDGDGQIVGQDTVLTIFGGSYYTINGIDIKDNPANVTPTMMFEFGIALNGIAITSAGGANLGCQNNIISNLTVSLNNTNAHLTVGISTLSRAVSNGGTGVAGCNSNNTFTNVKVRNCAEGYSFTGATFPDVNNAINQSGSGRSYISNIGPTTVNTNWGATGVIVTLQQNFSITNTCFDNFTYWNNSGTSGTITGISFFQTNYDAIISNDTMQNFSVLAGSTGKAGNINGITCGSSNVKFNENFSYNLFQNWNNTVASSGGGTILRAIGGANIGNNPNNTYNIFGNTITNFTTNTAGSNETDGIFLNNLAGAGNFSVYSNVITNLSSGSSGANGINLGSGPANLVADVHDNTVSNLSSVGGAVKGIVNSWGQLGATPINFYNNSVTNLSSSAAITGMSLSSLKNSTIRNNLVSNLASTGGAVTGITLGGSTADNVNNNTVTHLSTTANAVVQGMTLTGSATWTIYNNIINDLSSGSTTASSYGINIGSAPPAGTTSKFYNNMISDIRANAGTGILATSLAVYGFNLANITTTAVWQIYHNTVYLGTSIATSGTFTSACLLFNAGTPSANAYDIRNNIFCNNYNLAASGTGYAMAIWYNNATIGYAGINSTSNNNLVYSGGSGGVANTHLLLYDGTNAITTLGTPTTAGSYEYQMSNNGTTTKESNAVTGDPQIVSTTIGSMDAHLASSGCSTASGPAAHAGLGGLIPLDIDGNTRNVSTPDIGADEAATGPSFAGIITSSTGETIICPNASGVVLSVPAISGATSYTWTIPSGASFVGASTGNSVTVNFGSTLGNVTVQGTNSCGSGTLSTFVINNPTPTLGSVTQSAAVCGALQAIINLTGLLPLSNQTVSYTINGVTQPPAYITSTPTGTSNFYIPVFNANSGQVLAITSITNGCTTQNFVSGNTVTLSVNAAPVVTVSPLSYGICTSGTPSFAVSASPGTLTWTISQSNVTGATACASSCSSPVSQALTYSGTTGAGTATYTINGTNGGCSSSLVATAYVNVAPTLSSVTQAATCGGTPSTITLNGLRFSSPFIVNYTINSVAQTPKYVTSNASGVGTFTSVLPSSANGQTLAVTSIAYRTSSGLCSSTFSSGNSVVLSVTADPTLSGVTAAPACGGGNATINLAGLQASSTFTVYYTVAGGAEQTASVSSTVGGAGSFSIPVTLANNGQVVIITDLVNSATGCAIFLTSNNTVTLSVLNPPTAFTVSGGSASCGAVTVVQSGSTNGVSYQLYLNGSSIGSPVTGTGNSISFGSQNTLGTYTVIATNAGGCTANMNGSATANPTPIGGVVTTPFIIICSGNTTLLTVTGSAGSNYQWQISADNATWSDISGATNTTYTTASGDGTSNKFYRLLSKSITCWDVASTTAEVDVSNPVIAVTASSITDNTLILNWSPTGSGNFNITYSGTSSGFLTGITPPKTVTGLTADGTYSIVVTQTGVSGCSATGTLNVNTLCAVPTNLTATPSTVAQTQQLTVSWSGPAGNYRVYYRPLYSYITFFTQDVTNATTTVLKKQGSNNLYASNTYQVYVSRLDCPNTGNVGQSTSSIYVTTLPNPVVSCATPTIDTVFSSCPVLLEVQLHGSPTGNYNVYIQRLTPTLQAVNSYSISSGDFIINTSAGQQYLISADSKCSSTVSTLNIWHNNVTIKPICNAPANLILSNPTCHGFTASWNADQCISNTVSGYDLYMRQAGSINYNAYSVPLSVAPVGPHELVNWLGAGKNMQVFVQSIYSCGGSVTYGPSSQIVTITTASAGCRDEETPEPQETKPAVQQYSANNDEVFSLYPNPNTGEFTIDLSRLSNNADEVRIEVLNMIGQTVITHITSISDGHMREFITLPAGTPAGTYIVRLTAGKNVYTAKMNISK